MRIPSKWKTRRSSLPSSDDEEPLGHQDMGGTICLHSLAVDPEFQRMGLGSVLMKSYIARMKDSKIADRIALLAHDHLVQFYTGLGFENMGPSAVTSHGGSWNNMVYSCSIIARLNGLLIFTRYSSSVMRTMIRGCQTANINANYHLLHLVPFRGQETE